MHFLLVEFYKSGEYDRIYNRELLVEGAPRLLVERLLVERLLVEDD